MKVYKSAMYHGHNRTDFTSKLEFVIACLELPVFVLFFVVYVAAVCMCLLSLMFAKGVNKKISKAIRFMRSLGWN
jgi:hypothetical protein